MNAAPIVRVVLAIGALSGSATPSLAWTSRLETLKNNVMDHPDDMKSREEIMSLVRAMPNPPKPDDYAKKWMAEARKALAGARKREDLEAVIWKLESVTQFAPWWAEAYYDLGLALEKVGDYPAAVRAYKLFLIAGPRSKSATRLRGRLPSLEEKSRQAAPARHCGPKRASKTKVKIRFVNQRSGAVQTYKIDEICHERKWNLLSPGSYVDNEDSADTVWRLRDAQTRALLQEATFDSPRVVEIH